MDESSQVTRKFAVEICLNLSVAIVLAMIVILEILQQEKIRRHIENARACAKMTPEINEQLQKIEDLL